MKTLLSLLGIITLTPLAMAEVTYSKEISRLYQAKCQGCHRPDGTGDLTSTPPLAGEVAKFLAVPEGREFLGRVPGVASVNLSDERLAEVLNDTLYRFDAAHVPADFKPYTAAEIAVLRKAPLRLDRAEKRAALVARLEAKH